ncbi:acyl-CoA dehydrogenase family protein [Pseudomonas sp. JS3066]|uniref:acyl-CoA dehydrogenase family protein n=1 Tax=Pseudomonas sp. JS3066 TaxID=3090665 RepID=UPI002E7B389E|nr:acyl-CoA dehydrogenase family protein [Pseudomonas sp. JS3066]WVK92129.1 acyl-CoA dehydrogenase family protein [Pseudomonas sp. JS3066]
MPWQRLLEASARLTSGHPLDDWYGALLDRLGEVTPFELAVLGGKLAPTPGLAFLAGYQGALRLLWPSAPLSLGALCVTENRSVRPADMQTRLAGLSLSGRKDFVTAGDAADWLLVAAREEAEGESPRLALVVVRNGAPGVHVEQLKPLPLMPDVPHARLHLEGSHCERLAGDGWDAYVKPFRSIEDLHVLAAMVAWLYGVGRDSAWPQLLQLRLLSLLSGAAEVSRQCATTPTMHLLLAALFAEFKALKPELDAAFASGPAEWANLWQRDQGVLEIASGPRAKRLERARAVLGL